MSLRKFGIYLAYPPTVDLQAEGLGRHLAEFLKAAQERSDVRFAIACPSWMVDQLHGFFATSGVRPGSFELIAPRRKPLLLSLHQRHAAYRQRPKTPGAFAALRGRAARIGAKVRAHAEKKAVSTRSAGLIAVLGIVALACVALGAALQAVRWPLAAGAAGLGKAGARLARHPAIRRHLGKAGALATQPKQDSLAMRLYRLMEGAEAALLRELIAGRPDIAAWYSPTAFWPSFNDLPAPRLMCVPDVVLADFPVGFAPLGGERFLDNFRQVNRAIAGAEHFVTYSSEVKWRTLVERHHADPATITVIPHGANRLDELLAVSGFADNEAATNALCRALFKAALRKAVQRSASAPLSGEDLRFLFYASQFRPNKNLVSLLRAYRHLLRERYCGHKLVLTGHPDALPEVRQFIVENRLENDVLCLPGLSARELAACYRLADLAVNPSLSEGGCPFTFTEALSLGTPAVMARIAVTEEVIADPELQELMLFDPYDWQDMAGRIEWALNHRQRLLARQKPFYEQLAQRSWHQVVDDYVQVLARISAKREERPCQPAGVC